MVPEPTPSAVESDQPSRAGRNLPVATGVGVGLGAVFVGSLFWRSELFIAFAFVLILAVVIELRSALATRDLQVPVLPIAVGSAGMFVSAYLGGAAALLVAFVATSGAVFVWCVLDNNGLPALRSGSAAVFVVAYVPFLASFLVLALTQPDGAWRVFLVVVAVVASDTGGYIAGVLWGRHPLAPTVSPKKSWEGFAGSLALACGASTAVVTLALGLAWWFGLVVGALATIAAVVGDLGESLIKRDLGLKDMGSVLPGHGGVLDRVDALLVAAPLLVSAFAFLAPVAAQ
nr:phosphatidate cytidylyltransferase [Serinibacter salmoneus]